MADIDTSMDTSSFIKWHLSRSRNGGFHSQIQAAEKCLARSETLGDLIAVKDWAMRLHSELDEPLLKVGREVWVANQASRDRALALAAEAGDKAQAIADTDFQAAGSEGSQKTD